MQLKAQARDRCLSDATYGVKGQNGQSMIFTVQDSASAVASLRHRYLVHCTSGRSHLARVDGVFLQAHTSTTCEVLHLSFVLCLNMWTTVGSPSVHPTAGLDGDHATLFPKKLSEVRRSLSTEYSLCQFLIGPQHYVMTFDALCVTLSVQTHSIRRRVADVFFTLQVEQRRAAPLR